MAYVLATLLSNDLTVHGENVEEVITILPTDGRVLSSDIFIDIGVYICKIRISGLSKINDKGSKNISLLC